MKKIFLIPIAMLCFAVSTVQASLMEEGFVVETSDSDAVDSLNRVSGKIDTGFVSKDSDYYGSSMNHNGAGPFARQEHAYDVSSSS